MGFHCYLDEDLNKQNKKEACLCVETLSFSIFFDSNTEGPQNFFRECERCRESGLESKKGASVFHVRAKESAESEMTV